jgi:hypothetical protein
MVEALGDRAGRGKKVSEQFLQIEKIEGGKVTMAWVAYQNLGIMTQLGMLPSPAAPPAK